MENVFSFLIPNFLLFLYAVDNVKTPTTSLYTSCVLSQSELVTPTPSKLTKTPMPDTTFTPTLSETK